MSTKELARALGIAVAGLLLAGAPATAGGHQRTRPPGSTSGDAGDRAVPRDTGTPAPSPPAPSPPPRDTSPPPRDTSPPPPRDTSPPPRDTSPPPRDTATPRDGGGRRTKGTEVKFDNPSDVRDVPEGSRPRGDRPAIDTAVPRIGPRPPRDSGDRNDKRDYPGGVVYAPYAPFYDPFAYYDCGYGLGYDFSPGGYYSYPVYSPYGFGYGMPYGYAPCGGMYDGGGSPGLPRTHGGQDQGTLKLKVKPRNAKVYVDGFYVGLVDQFDGAYQELTLNSGRHVVEIRSEGFETAVLQVDITPDKTVTFAGKMIQLKKIQ